HKIRFLLQRTCYRVKIAGTDQKIFPNRKTYAATNHYFDSRRGWRPCGCGLLMGVLERASIGAHCARGRKARGKNRTARAAAGIDRDGSPRDCRIVADGVAGRRFKSRIPGARVVFRTNGRLEREAADP